MICVITEYLKQGSYPIVNTHLRVYICPRKLIEMMIRLSYSSNVHNRPERNFQESFVKTRRHSHSINFLFSFSTARF